MPENPIQQFEAVFKKNGLELTPEEISKVVQNIEQLADLIYKFEERRKSNFGLSPPNNKK